MVFMGVLAVVLGTAATGPSVAQGQAPPAGRSSSPPTTRAAIRAVCAPGQGLKLVRPTGNGIYHTAYFSEKPTEDVYDANTISNFEALTGQQVAGVYFSNHWGHGGTLDLQFPQQIVDDIHAAGAIPMIRMMPWTRKWVTPERVTTMGHIARGDFDTELRAWFDDARDTGFPLFVEFGVEVNGEWFPWNGKYAGKGATTAFGDPNVPDGPERFVAAYRHLVDLSNEEGAYSLTWNFHVDADGWPRVGWNDAANYYPGDAYVDWVSFSDYGEQRSTDNPDKWFGFSKKLGDPLNAGSSYAKIASIAPTKPLAAMEFGVAEDPGAGDKGTWIADAYQSMTDGTYEVDLVSYWSEHWRNGNGTTSYLNVDSSAGSLSAYMEGISGPRMVTTPVFVCG